MRSAPRYPGQRVASVRVVPHPSPAADTRQRRRRGALVQRGGRGRSETIRDNRSICRSAIPPVIGEEPGRNYPGSAGGVNTCSAGHIVSTRGSRHNGGRLTVETRGARAGHSDSMTPDDGSISRVHTPVHRLASAALSLDGGAAVAAAQRVRRAPRPELGVRVGSVELPDGPLTLRGESSTLPHEGASSGARGSSRASACGSTPRTRWTSCCSEEMAARRRPIPQLSAGGAARVARMGIVQERVRASATHTPEVSRLTPKPPAATGA